MAKIVLDTVSSGYNLGKINANFDKLETELNDKVLYRDNTSLEANQMEQPLDMNNQRILNLPPPVDPTDALRLQDLIDAGIDGVTPVVQPRQTADGATATFAVPAGTTSANALFVYVNGVYQSAAVYTFVVSTSSITFVEVPELNDVVEVTQFSPAFIDDWIVRSDLPSDMEPVLEADLSQAYTFDTVASFKASTIVFPVGKVIHLLDRGAEFTVITGTGTANTFNIIASTSVSQSIVLNDVNSIDYLGATQGVECRTQLEFADSEGEAIIPKGDWVIKSATTLSNKLTFLDDAQLEVPTGQTLTINGLVFAESGRYPFTGEGDVVINKYVVDVPDGANIQSYIDDLPRSLYQKIWVRLADNGDYTGQDVKIEAFKTAGTQHPLSDATESARLLLFTTSQDSLQLAKLNSLWISGCNGNGNPNCTHFKILGFNPWDNETAGVANYNSDALISYLDYTESVGVKKAVLSYGGANTRTGFTNYGIDKVDKALVVKVMGSIYDDGSNTGQTLENFSENQSGMIYVTNNFGEVRAADQQNDTLKRIPERKNGFVVDADTQSLIGPQLFAHQTATMWSTMFESLDGYIQAVGATGLVSLNTGRGLQLSTQGTGGGTAQVSMKRNHTLSEPTWESSYTSLAVALEINTMSTGFVIDFVIGDLASTHTGFRIRNEGGTLTLFGVLNDGAETELNLGVTYTTALTTRFEVRHCKTFVEFWQNKNLLGKIQTGITGTKPNVKFDYRVSNTDATNTSTYISEMRLCSS